MQQRPEVPARAPTARRSAAQEAQHLLDTEDGRRHGDHRSQNAQDGGLGIGDAGGRSADVDRGMGAARQDQGSEGSQGHASTAGEDLQLFHEVSPLVRLKKPPSRYTSRGGENKNLARLAV